MKKVILGIMMSAMLLTSCATAKRNPELTKKELKEKKKHNRKTAKDITLSSLTIIGGLWLTVFFIKQ